MPDWRSSIDRLAATCRPAAACCLAALLLLGAAGDCRAQPASAVAGPGAGIWKAVVPPTPMQGEFDSFDPLGVAAGAKIKADCSLNWINPDDGKRYCFSSGTSLEYFLDKPQANIEKARQGWKKLTADQVPNESLTMRRYHSSALRACCWAVVESSPCSGSWRIAPSARSNRA